MIEKVREFETDAGFISTTGNITPKLLKAILNTENFRLDEEKGDHQIRTIQQALNRSYSNYMDLIPCNGIYGKFTNKGLIRALQHEIGETVDGVFAAGRCQNVLLLSVVGLHLNQLFSFYNMPFVVINLIQINLTVFLELC